MKNLSQPNWTRRKMYSYNNSHTDNVRMQLNVFVFTEESLHLTTDGPRGPGGVSRVSGARDEVRSLSSKRRWIPPSSIRQDALAQENPNDVIFRKVQGILNKLTPDKFEKLSDDILAIDLSSYCVLKGVILLIFKKALDEPKFSSMYAQLCKRLSEEAPNSEPPEESNTFKKLLLANCEEQFEKRAQATEKYEQNDGQISPDDEDRHINAKRKMLGNIKFIGELGKLEILSENILHKCIQALFHSARSRAAKVRDVTEDVECLAQIMRTCGRILDTDKGQILMDQYFDRMKVLAENQEFPKRIRFMLQGVIELRKNNWVPRKAMEGPMPMNQIRNDDKIRPYVTDTLPRLNPNAGLDGLFRNPLKTRGGLDDVLGVSNFNPNPQFLPHDNYNKGFVTNNGFQSSAFRSNRGGPGVFYRQHNNNYNNNKQNAQQHYNSNNLPPRFKKNIILGTQLGAPGVEDISLRPATFKPPQPKPVPQLSTGPAPIFIGRSNPLVPEPILPPPQPQTQICKEPPILIKQASSEKGKSAKKDKGPSKEDVLKKLTVILNEHLTADKISECITPIKELKAPDRFMSCIIFHILNHTIDNNADSERNLSISLIVEMKKEGMLTTDKFLEALRELLSSMSEKEQQIPRIHSYVAGYIKQAILGDLVTLATIADITDGGTYYPLFMLVLQALCKSEGKQKLTQLFNESKVDLLSQVVECDRTKEKLSEILAERDLSFLYPLSTIQSSLWKQLQADSNPAQFYKWVKENLDPSHYTNPGFINALVTVILKYITQESTLPEGSDPNVVPEKHLIDKEKSLLEKYKPVLGTFLHEKQELQVIAVYSLQVLCYSLKFPKGMLLRWFNHLYDLEIVEEEAFMKWKEDITDSYPGKGKALFQVNQWLTWLEEAESEEEEEDDDDNDN
ncbi:UNVERIFIED_CONTAM: hypothetical protein PYX00_010221 [Menopon gallinae]|uniref:Eukaryotic translation initiation factor 4 gamma 2 n=2 Tax=Menopon gallinae TaxID=328185 RepID=A0AAW2HEG0_9NEOP